MASIIRRTEDVAAACAARLDGIKKLRDKAVNDEIEEMMSETKGTFFKVPRYASKEEALEAMKKDQRDFFWFGSKYDYLMSRYWETEQNLKKLQAMCKCAGVIRLETEDFNLVKGYL